MTGQIEDTKDGVPVRTVAAAGIMVHAATGPMLATPSMPASLFIRGAQHVPADVARFAHRKFWPGVTTNAHVVLTDAQGMVLHPPQPSVDTRSLFRSATAFHVYLAYTNP
jgi:hypothetical protein